MADLVMHRWTQFGYDRLYIADPGGMRLGYVDLKTNEVHPAQPETMSYLATAAADYLRRPRRLRDPGLPRGHGRHELHK